MLTTPGYRIFIYSIFIYSILLVVYLCLTDNWYYNKKQRSPHFLFLSEWILLLRRKVVPRCWVSYHALHMVEIKTLTAANLGACSMKQEKSIKNVPLKILPRYSNRFLTHTSSITKLRRECSQPSPNKF